MSDETHEEKGEAEEMTDKELIEDILTRADIPFEVGITSDYDLVESPAVRIQIVTPYHTERDPLQPKVFGYDLFSTEWFFSERDGRLLAIANWE